MKNTIEIFVAGCPYCDSAVKLVKEVTNNDDEIKVYNLAGVEKEEVKKVADGYGVTTVPAVAVNGSLLECCKTGGVTRELLVSALS